MFDTLIPLRSSLPRGHTRRSLSGGVIATAETIDVMRDMATVGKRDFRVRKKIGELLQHCPSKDYLCYANKILDYCQNKMRYAFDPNGVELVANPGDTLDAQIADCDCVVTLCAAMLENIGLQCRYVTIKADTTQPDEYSHVYIECQIPGHGWVSMDPTMPGTSLGWKPDPKWPKKYWSASKDVPEDHGGDQMIKMSGLGDDVAYREDAGLPFHDVDPGTEDSVAVRQGNLWAWRQEPALVLTTPEELELQPIVQRGALVAGVGTQEFFMKEDAGRVMAEKAEAINAVQGSGQPQRPVLVARPQQNIWPWLVGAAVIGLLFFRGGK